MGDVIDGSPDAAGGAIVMGIEMESAIVVQSLGNVTVEATPAAQKDEHTDASNEEDRKCEAATADTGGGEALKGRKVSKRFGRKFYTGEIIGYDPETHWYKISYEDGDQEELWWNELEPILASPKRRPQSQGQHSRAVRRKKVQTETDDDSDTTDELFERFYIGSGAELDGSCNVKEASTEGKKSLKKRKQHDEEAKLVEVKLKLDDPSANLKKTRTRTRKQYSPSKQEEPGRELVGSAIKKKFGKKMYHGEVIDYDPEAKYYKIRYEDGDEEELDWDEIKPTLVSMPNPDRNDTGVITTDSGEYLRMFHPALAVPSKSEAENLDLEFHAWGEVVSYDKAKCPVLQAATELPCSSRIVHIAASHHHVAALTEEGQVWLWRNEQGRVTERRNKWEHVDYLDDKNVVLLDIAGPDQTSDQKRADCQEGQVPDPFYMVAISRDGSDYIMEGPAHEPVCTVSSHRPLSSLSEQAGCLVQVSMGVVDDFRAPPFIGYITRADRVYIRHQTEVNEVTGFWGKPLKIQCGRAYHAIIVTDDGRAWTWKHGTQCQLALGSLKDRKVIDASCYGEDFLALTEDGDVHFWTNGSADPASDIHNEPTATNLKPASDETLKGVFLGAGLIAGLSNSGKLHTWRASKIDPRLQATPLGRDEEASDSAIAALEPRDVINVVCVAGSLIVVSQERS